MLTSIEQVNNILRKIEDLEVDLNELNPEERWLFECRLEQGPDYDLPRQLASLARCTGCDKPLAGAVAQEIGCCDKCMAQYRKAWEDASNDSRNDS